MSDNNVQRYRDALGLSQGQLAALAGVTQSTVSKIEAGGDTTVAIGAAIARALGRTVEDVWPHK